jgi:hypothetical protein
MLPGGERMAFTMEEEQPQVPFDAPPCGGLLRPGSSTARRGGAFLAGRVCGGASLRMTFVFLIGVVARLKSCPDTNLVFPRAVKLCPFKTAAGAEAHFSFGALSARLKQLAEEVASAPRKEPQGLKPKSF